MRLRRLLVLGVLAPTLAAGSQSVETVGRLPGAPETLLDLLPPGARARTTAARPIAPGDNGFRRERLTLGSTGPLEIEYTLDAGLETRVAGVLEEEGVELGHVIVMDPVSGEVHAYVSTRPDAFPADGTYPTASLMKIVTAAAALRTAPDAPERDCRYRGSPYQVGVRQLHAPRRGGLVTSFWRAMAISNNQCFARLAVHDLGADRLLDEIRRVGLLEAPARGHPEARLDPVEAPLALGHLGSGLGGSWISPLSAARLASLLAEGELVQPRWIAGARDANGTPLELPRPAATRPVWPEPLARSLREGLVRVTEEGTARRAFRTRRGDPLLGPIRVAGKTGTLTGREPDGRYQWFVGVAPIEAPSIAIAAVVVQPLPGSRSPSATQVAAGTLQEIFCNGGHGDRCSTAGPEALRGRAQQRDAAWQRARANARQERIDAWYRAMAAAQLHDANRLDEPPRPIGKPRLEFPPDLRRKKAHGRIVVLLDLGPDGEVEEARVESSELPDFDAVVLEQVAGWRFTPPRENGRPVRARARLPIPIVIN